MGTTITVAAVDSDSEQVIIGHVGDSRAYRLRDGIIQRLTNDHSRSRRCDAAARSPRSRPRTIPSVRSSPGRLARSRRSGRPHRGALRAGRHLPALLRRTDHDDRGREDPRHPDGATSLDAAARTLVDEANRAGGRDNITVIVFQVEDPARPLPKGEQPTMIRRGGSIAELPAAPPAAAGRR